MNRTSLLPLLAAAALAGCQGETVVLNPDGTEVNQAREEAVQNVQLPPSIVGSGKYRCRDNSLISVDWLSDGTANSARVTPDGGSAVILAQAEAGGPYTAQGANMGGELDAQSEANAADTADTAASMNGEPGAQSVTYNGQSCSR